MDDEVEVKGAAIFRTGQIHLKREARVHIPRAVQRERELTYAFTKSITQSTQGDPVPWRSGLAKQPKK